MNKNHNYLGNHEDTYVVYMDSGFTSKFRSPQIYQIDPLMRVRPLSGSERPLSFRLGPTPSSCEHSVPIITQLHTYEYEV